MCQDMPRMQDFAPFNPELLGALSGPPTKDLKMYIFINLQNDAPKCQSQLSYIMQKPSKKYSKEKLIMQKYYATNKTSCRVMLIILPILFLIFYYKS